MEQSLRPLPCNESSMTKCEMSRMRIMKFWSLIIIFLYVIIHFLIKHLCVLNNNISIKDGSKIHSIDLFLSSLRDLLFKATLLPCRCLVFMANEIREYQVELF